MGSSPTGAIYLQSSRIYTDDRLGKIIIAVILLVVNVSVVVF